jgi:hypothetical protein
MPPVIPEKSVEQKLDDLTALVKATEASLGEELVERKQRETTARTWREFLAHANPAVGGGVLHLVNDFERAEAENIRDYLQQGRNAAPERVRDSVVRELRSYPAVGLVSIALRNGECRIRKEGEAPKHLQDSVIEKLAPF